MELRKVYDSDVQTSPLLRQIARQYAEEYIGDFAMMIDYKHRVLAGGDLSDASVRAILNSLRYDTDRDDLQAAVNAVLRHPSMPPPEQVAEVIQFDQAARRIERREKVTMEQQRRQQYREVYMNLTPEQFRVHAIFATATWKAKNPVLHWVRPDGHEASWYLDWNSEWDEGVNRGYEDTCIKGSGVEREFRLTIRTFCKPMNQGYHKLWLLRPTAGDAWRGHEGDDTPLPDCKGCLRNIALEWMDAYPPDRNILTGEYPEDWR